MLAALLYVVALVCFVIAAFWSAGTNAPRVNLVALGLAFFTAGHLVGVV